ncbi:MAG TPA: hypothetical protein VJP77_05865 [Planctomycetota bacterium]|nr:hypothetical protein [Planctomycetota bacterium]
MSPACQGHYACCPNPFGYVDVPLLAAPTYRDVPPPKVQATDNGNGTWSILCPWCGKKHTHGSEAGHRVGHCAVNDTDGLDLKSIGYVLVAPKRKR